MKFRKLAAAFVFVSVSSLVNVASAATYTEDFNAPFPAWEGGWLGTYSNLTDYYCATRGCSERGNNPDGIWPKGNGNGNIEVTFDSSFGASITSLSLDVASYTTTNLLVYDASNTLIFSELVNNTRGAYTLPGVYSSYKITSLNGISKFVFDSPSASGNISIDNVVVTTVPEPETYAMFLGGLGLIGATLKRRNKVQA